MSIPVLYFRSSSYNCFDNCEQQYYISYILGFENPSTKAATLGNCTHKALECIANAQLCIQQGKVDGFEEENLGFLTLKDCEPDRIIERSFDWHRKYFEHPNWNDKKDLEDCRKWMWMVLNDKIYDPRRRKIIKAEQSFDFEIKEPWAKYHYDLGEKGIFEGYLRLKGTIDLVTETHPNCLEVIDWKTGAYRTDFATGKEKNFDSFHDDFQLRLYSYACHKLFPDKRDITITIYYIRVGGAFTVMLGETDLVNTEKMIRTQFEKIKNVKHPKLNPGPYWSDKPNPAIASFKCAKLCRFSQPNKFSKGKPFCRYIKEEIEKVGIEKVTERFVDADKLGKYLQGGGKGYERKNEE